MTLLLDNGADPNCNSGQAPLSVTYRTKFNNWYEISLVLIDYGANINYITNYPKSSVLNDIVYRHNDYKSYDDDNEDVIQSFMFALENCKQNLVDWPRVLSDSIHFDYVEIVDFLLANEYCNSNDIYMGETPLMCAARCSTTEMVQLLLEYGADENAVDADGMSALDYAVKYKNTEVISLLSKTLTNVP